LKDSDFSTSSGSSPAGSETLKATFLHFAGGGGAANVGDGGGGVDLICVTNAGVRYYCDVREGSVSLGFVKANGNSGVFGAERGGRGAGRPRVTSSFCSEDGGWIVSWDGYYYDNGSSMRAGSAPQQSFNGSAFFGTQNQDTSASNITNDGDVITAYLKDCAATKIVVDDSNPNNLGINDGMTTSVIREEYIPAEGSAEVISIPSSRLGSTLSPSLPGGRIWQIGTCGGDVPRLTTLFKNSTTPSDSELGMSIPPPYVPPMRKTTADVITTSSMEEDTSINRSDSGMLTTTLRTIIRAMKRKRDDEGGQNNTDTPPYTALPNDTPYVLTTSSSHDNSKTNGNTLPLKPALPSYLSAPKSTPLPPLSNLHLSSLNSSSSQNSLIALNHDGLHCFKISSPLVYLSRAIQSNNKDLIHSFFKWYGNVEGCATCFLVAIHARQAQDAVLEKRALQAALSHAHRPSLVSYNATPDSATGGMGNNDILGQSHLRPVIMTDVNGTSLRFQPSSLHDGLYKLVSRLLRPVWFKPLVILEETSSIISVTPLLSPTTLQRLHEPLSILLSLLRSTIAPAVLGVPSLPSSAGGDASGGGENCLLLTSQWRANAPVNAEVVARYHEETSLHNLYRLLSRTIQTLSLFGLLLRSSSPAVRINWGYLHALSVCTIVTSPLGQERVQSILSELITSSRPSPALQNLTTSLEKECHFYFSPGCRLLIAGLASLARGDAGQGGVLLRRAAQYWKSPSLVVVGGGASMAAKRGDVLEWGASCSPVARAAAALMRVGNVGGVVDVCLVTAANFGGTVKGTSAEDDEGVMVWEEDGKKTGLLSWEVGLYQNDGVVLVDNGRKEGGMATTGMDVTCEDARVACYSILLHHLDSLLVNNNNANGTLDQSMKSSLLNRMLSVASASADVMFQHRLYYHLISRQAQETLLRINSPLLENWLSEYNVMLLWKYYTSHGRDDDAGKVMLQRATATNIELAIDERVECLTRAKHSFATANSGAGTGADLSREELRVRELLEVAGIQVRILAALTSTPNNYDIVTPLKNQLISVSELFNDYAGPNGLYELCLSIMKCCNHRDTSTIETLWRSLLAVEVGECRGSDTDTGPLTANRNFEESSARAFLDRLRRGTPLETVGASATGGNKVVVFEEGEWLGVLKEKIVRIGRELYAAGGGGEFVFPVAFLVKEMEGLWQAYKSVNSSAADRTKQLGTAAPWPVQCMVEVGVPYSVILESYTDLLDELEREVGAHPMKRVQYLASVAELLKHWISSASSSGATIEFDNATALTLFSQNGQSLIGGSNNGSTNENPSVQLAVALSSGLRSNMDNWKASVEGIVGGDTEEIAKVLAMFTEVEDLLGQKY